MSNNFGAMRKIKLGDKFGRYEILEVLGQGGMGKVYKAMDLQLQRTVALKIISASLISTDKQRQRFLIEARATAQLNHSNIVRLYDIGVESGMDYFTMDYIKGISLGTLLEKDNTSICDFAKIMIEICKAINYAHKQGIIHRDLKPDNIVVDSELKPYVMDFGLAKILKEESQITQKGVIVGTLAYMSPEQAEGKNQELDSGTDIYSLGAIFYQLLTKQPPFSGSSPFEIMKKILCDPLIVPTQINAQIPKELEDICLKAMAKERKKRHDTALQMAQELEKFVQPKKAGYGKIVAVLLLGFGIFISYQQYLFSKLKQKKSVIVPKKTAQSLAKSNPNKLPKKIYQSISSIAKRLKQKPLLVVIDKVYYKNLGIEGPISKTLRKLTKEALKKHPSFVLKKATSSASLNIDYENRTKDLSIYFSLEYRGETQTWEVHLEDIEIKSNLNVKMPKNFNKIKAILENIGANVAGSFDFELTTPKGKVGAIYKNGEYLKLEFRSSQPCYIQVYYVQENSKIVQLFPNEFEPSEKIEANRWYTIPEEKYSFSLEVKCKKQQLEMFKAVASLKPLATAKGKDLGYGLREISISAKELMQMHRKDNTLVEGLCTILQKKSP